MTIYGFHTATNYDNTQNALRGCINDYINIKANICQYYNISNDNSIPLIGVDYTYDNVMKYSKEFPDKMISGDILLYTNSSHGTKVKDYNNDELDNKDEAICPNDFRVISDDYIYEYIKLFSQGCTLYAIFDNCFAGTIDRSIKPIFRTIENVKANVVIFSGCGEQQTSADAYIDGKFQGALTYCIIEVLNKYKYDVTNLELLEEVNKMLKRGRYSQIAELACTLNMENKIFMT